MKTLASLAIVLATAVALAGCGPSTDTKSKAGKTVSKGAAKSPDKNTADAGGATAAGPAAESKAHSVVGVVKEIDMAEGTVVLEHEAVTSLNWPATTRTFALRGALISQLQGGQKVGFEFVQRNGENVVTALK